MSSLGFGQSNIFGNIIYLAMGTLLGGFTSFCIDSYFWGRPLIPEIDSFIFNIVQGKSTEWGTEPWDTYFKKYLFQLFRPPVILMLAIPGLINDPANDGTKFGDKKSVPTLQGIHCVFCSSPLFCLLLQCLSNLTKNGDSLFILFQFSHYKLQME